MNYKRLIRFPHKLISFLLPQSCFLCGDNSIECLCPACLRILPFRQKRQVCIDCTNIQVQSVFSYMYPIDKLIIAAKFHQNLAVLNLLGNLMAQHLQHLTIENRPDVLIPVPLHSKRLRKRGYNQSLELAKRINKKTGIPLAYKSCKRIKETLPQTSLSAQQRQSNIVDAFQVVKLKKEWRHIVLIDDVMTTGATVKELAKVFMKQGVQRVDVWCCASR